MEKEKVRIEQTIKLLKWAEEYKGWWQVICTPSDKMTPDFMKLLIEQLSKESLYEIIFVLLTVHRNQTFVADANEKLLKELILKEMEIGNKDEIIEFFINYLE